MNLGAGLDTRPYRLALPPTLRWIEVDFAATIDFKNERLAGETPRCRLERRAVDLRDATMRAALLDDVDASCAKVLVLTEGVVGYLTNEAVAALATDLHARPRIAHWVLEYSSAEFRKIERLLSRRRRKQMTKAPLQFEPGDWRAFFAARGWNAKEIRFFIPAAERHGRPLPVSPWMKLALRVVTLNNPSVMRENVGFALMERDSVAK